MLKKDLKRENKDENRFRPHSRIEFELRSDESEHKNSRHLLINKLEGMLFTQHRNALNWGFQSFLLSLTLALF